MNIESIIFICCTFKLQLNVNFVCVSVVWPRAASGSDLGAPGLRLPRTGPGSGPASADYPAQATAPPSRQTPAPG